MPVTIPKSKAENPPVYNEWAKNAKKNHTSATRITIIILTSNLKVIFTTGTHSLQAIWPIKCS